MHKTVKLAGSKEIAGRMSKQMKETKMFEVKLRKQVVIINEQGTAEITYKVKFQNKSDHPEPLIAFGITEGASDVVNIRVTHGKRSFPYAKSMKKGFVGINVDLREITLEANKTFDILIRFEIPTLAKRFDHSYFHKGVFTHSHPRAETCEWIVTYYLPELFSRKEFWKELYVNAPQVSRIYTRNGRPEAVEYQFVLQKGSHREISFMFQERYNSRIIALLSFLLGVGLIQFFEWLVGLLF